MSDMPMAQTEAEKLLLFWVERFEADVKKLVTQKLNENQLSALTSFAYNIGTEKFKKSTLLKRINENPISPGIASEWRKWKFGAVNGKMTILPGLVKRREAEIALYYS
jgi:lysozyme